MRRHSKFAIVQYRMYANRNTPLGNTILHIIQVGSLEYLKPKTLQNTGRYLPYVELALQPSYQKACGFLFFNFSQQTAGISSCDIFFGQHIRNFHPSLLNSQNEREHIPMMAWHIDILIVCNCLYISPAHERCIIHKYKMRNKEDLSLVLITCTSQDFQVSAVPIISGCLSF